MLEFLIAHQDWFMLDIAPPTPSRRVGAADSAEGDSPWLEDDELGGDGWKLVESEPGKVRRRASSVTSGPGASPPDGVPPRTAEVKDKRASISNPIGAGANVSRSKTLPSNANGRQGRAGEGSGTMERRVLHKRPTTLRTVSSTGASAATDEGPAP